MNQTKDLFVIVHPDGRYLSFAFEKEERIEWQESILDATTMPGIIAGFKAMKIQPAPTIQSLEDAMKDHFKRKGIK